MMDAPVSLEKLEEFIGREGILRELREWFADGGLHIAFYSGPFGIGKNRLLNRALTLS